MTATNIKKRWSLLRNQTFALSCYLCWTVLPTAAGLATELALSTKLYRHRYELGLRGLYCAVKIVNNFTMQLLTTYQRLHVTFMQYVTRLTITAEVPVVADN